MTYGKRLDQALDYAKKSRKELAHHLGCTPQTIGIVITGAGKTGRKLSTDNHSKAVEFLRINGDWLLTGEGEMVPTTATATITAPLPALQSYATNNPLAHVQQAQTAINSVALSPNALMLAQWLDDMPDDKIKFMTFTECMALITKRLECVQPSVEHGQSAPQETSSLESHDLREARKTALTADTDPRAR